MPGQGIDLSKIQLPPEDADKPADLDFNPAGDDGIQNDSNKPANQIPEDNKPDNSNLGDTEDASREPIVDPKKETPKEDAKPDGDGKPTDTPAVDPDKKEDKPADGEKPKEEAKDGEDKDKDNVPFHKNPDWIKKQEELETVKLEKAKLEGKLEVMEKKGIISEERKEEAKSAAKIAEEAVEAKYKDGWTPRDALELNRVYSEEFEKALDAKEAAKAEEQTARTKEIEERRTEIAKQVEGVYTEFGITNETEQNAAAELAMKWANEGTANWSIGSLKLAVEHLKAKGEIGKAAPTDPTPKPVVNPAAPTENDNEDKKDVNKKISKPTSEGGATNTPAKKSIADLRRKSLDDIVLENQEALG